MTVEERNAMTMLAEQTERARTAVEEGRYKEALDALDDGALNAFRLQDVSALREIGALAREVVEKTGDGYVKARGAGVNRSAQSYRSRSWQVS
jgi:hypothetical protein